MWLEYSTPRQMQFCIAFSRGQSFSNILHSELFYTSWDAFQITGAPKYSHYSLPLKLTRVHSVNVCNIHLMRRTYIFFTVGPALSVFSPFPAQPHWQNHGLSETLPHSSLCRRCHVSRTHICTLCYVHLLRLGPVCGWKSDRMLCRVRKFKPYNPIKGGQFMTLAAAGVLTEAFQRPGLTALLARKCCKLPC